MYVCAVCAAGDYREELAAEVFNFEGHHLVIEGIPCTVCERCGEQSFSRETAKRVRIMLHSEARPESSAYTYTHCEPSDHD